MKNLFGGVDDELRIRLEKEKKNRYFCLDFTHDIFLYKSMLRVDWRSKTNPAPAVEEYEAAKTSAKPAH